MNSSVKHSAIQPLIHPTAIIDPSARIHETVLVGPYSIIGPDVSIAAYTQIGPHVVITRSTRLGQHNRVFQFATLGEDPQDLKYAGEDSWLEIGDHNIIRESCTLHRGTAQDQGLTRIGNRNLFMVNTHVAHDCVIGNDCVMANNVGIAGHVRVGDSVIIGGNSGVHQFCHLGPYSMVAGGSVLFKDLPAYVTASGSPAHAHGMNVEGMRRRGWSAQTINLLRQAFKVVYKQGLTTQQALDVLRTQLLPQCPEVAPFIESIEHSTRGIVR